MVAALLFVAEWVCAALVLLFVLSGLAGQPGWFAAALVALAAGLMARGLAASRARRDLVASILPRLR